MFKIEARVQKTRHVLDLVSWGHRRPSSPGRVHAVGSLTALCHSLLELKLHGHFSVSFIKQFQGRQTPVALRGQSPP